MNLLRGIGAGQCVNFSRIMREIHARKVSASCVSTKIPGKGRGKCAGTGGAKSPIGGKRQKADMNRNRIMRTVLVAGLLFFTQAQADSVVSLLAQAHGLQSVTPGTWQSRHGTYW